MLVIVPYEASVMDMLFGTYMYMQNYTLILYMHILLCKWSCKEAHFFTVGLSFIISTPTAEAFVIIIRKNDCD